jgi:hypothetical protein
MTDIAGDKRRHERTHFFLVPTEQERVRYWVFKPEDEIDARAGVILDMSEGGLKILVDPSGPVAALSYRVRILVEPGGWTRPLECTMRLVWSEPDGNHGYMAGFKFESGAEDVLRYISTNPPSIERRTWICCTLRDAASAG